MNTIRMLLLKLLLMGKAEIYRGESALVTLPSGALRWLRPVKIVESTQSELGQISEQLKILKPTDSKNVKEHVALAQRLQDVLYQEGLIISGMKHRADPLNTENPGWSVGYLMKKALKEI